jgi:hypothetical protein
MCESNEKMNMDQFLKCVVIFKDDMKDKLVEIIKSMSDITLPATVDEAIDKAVAEMKEYVEKKGQKSSKINWTHFTFATEDNQFKIDQDDDGKWHVTSEEVYMKRGSGKSLEELFEYLDRDINLLSFLMERAEDGTVGKYLED